MEPEALKNVGAKLAAIQKEVEHMEKDGRNAAQGYNYLSEAQITAQFKPLLEKHGIVFIYASKITGSQHSPKGTQIVTDVEVTYQFLDVETGHYIQGRAAGQGADSGDKGVYKAITGAVKYIFMKTFLIPTGDDPEKDEQKARSAKTKEEEAFEASLDED